VFPLLERWLKNAALEVQEYVFLTQRAFYGVFTRPIYRHDIVEQFDLIGAGSLTVVVLSGLFTGAALTSQSGLTLDQFGARPLVGRLVSASISSCDAFTLLRAASTSAFVAAFFSASRVSASRSRCAASFWKRTRRKLLSISASSAL
jgi:ABC-type transporter Mla maintaining outer membrane lipid asymmetry permease subunit MlaE